MDRSGSQQVEIVRGAVVIAVLPGDAGKPRPAVVLCADSFAGHHRVPVVPLTSELQSMPTLRVTLQPSPGNCLEEPSQAMIDRLASVAATRIRQQIGRLNSDELLAIERGVLAYLGFGNPRGRRVRP